MDTMQIVFFADFICLRTSNTNFYSLFFLSFNEESNLYLELEALVSLTKNCV